jgi:hypothetical protein
VQAERARLIQAKAVLLLNIYEPDKAHPNRFFFAKGAQGRQPPPSPSLHRTVRYKYNIAATSVHGSWARTELNCAATKQKGRWMWSRATRLSFCARAVHVRWGETVRTLWRLLKRCNCFDLPAAKWRNRRGAESKLQTERTGGQFHCKEKRSSTNVPTCFLEWRTTSQQALKAIQRNGSTGRFKGPLQYLLALGSRLEGSAYYFPLH